MVCPNVKPVLYNKLVIKKQNKQTENYVQPKLGFAEIH